MRNSLRYLLVCSVLFTHRDARSVLASARRSKAAGELTVALSRHGRRLACCRTETALVSPALRGTFTGGWRVSAMNETQLRRRRGANL